MSSLPAVVLITGEGAIDLADSVATAADATDMGIHVVELRSSTSSPLPASEISIRLETAFRAAWARGISASQLLVAADAMPTISVVEAALLLERREIAALDAIVAVVHGPSATVRLASTGTAVPDPLATAVAIADRLVIGAADRIHDLALTEVARSLRAENRIAPVAAPAVDPIPFGALVSIGCWRGPLAKGPPAPPRPGGAMWPSAFETLSFRPLSPMTLDLLRISVDQLLAIEPGILRVQGLLPVTGGGFAQVRGSGRTGSVFPVDHPGADEPTGRGAVSGSLTVVARAGHARSITDALGPAMVIHDADLEAST